MIMIMNVTENGIIIFNIESKLLSQLKRRTESEAFKKSNQASSGFDWIANESRKNKQTNKQMKERKKLTNVYENHF